MDYWHERTLKAQEAILKRTVEDIEKQITKYYQTASRNIVGGFLYTYNKIMNTQKKGKDPTPADLYRLDTYWKQQAQIQNELQRLGDKQTELYLKKFRECYFEIYNSIALKDDSHFQSINNEIVEHMITMIWNADGKSWSDRIWDNTSLLRESLNEGLIECLLNGRSPRELRERLMYEFDVSWNRADTLVRTETAHIQTQATKHRYEDAGIKEVYVWADEDERRCDICGKLHEKRFLITDKMPVPAHPRCRCRILPVIE